MLKEMQIELAFHPGLELIMKDADGSSEKQMQDIEDLVREGIDLLIVSPNESKPLTSVVEKAYINGLPVIVIDRKIESNAYTAYIGADNYEIGKEAGNYAALILNGQGKIAEIWGLEGSSPAIERHKGFVESINKYPQIRFVYTGYGKWNFDDAKALMEKSLDSLPAFDLLFAHNDAMAMGAYEVLAKNGLDSSIRFLGIDALPGTEGGIQKVIDGKLDATLLYPTGGELAIQTAWNILTGQPFKKENTLQTVLITSSNAKIIKMQTDQVQSRQSKIESLSGILEKQVTRFNSQRNLLISSFITLGLFVIGVFLLLIAYRIKRSANIKLMNQKKEIEKANLEISIQRDQLIEISEQLREATEAKIRFFTNISHEFRTPLTLILDPLENMQGKPGVRSADMEQIRMMHRNATRLLRLINQIMDFSKLENQRMSLHAIESDIVPFIREIKESFDALAVQRQIKYELIDEIGSFRLWFDREKMDKVFVNLIGNAFKFTPVKGHIVISILKINHDEENSTGKSLTIEISDTGKGIKPEHRDKVFDRFFQIESSEEFHTAGTGIGLALSKSLIELHHGSITIKSSSDEAGTVFAINLPVGKDHLSESEVFLTDDYEFPGRQISDTADSFDNNKKNIKRIPDSATRAALNKELPLVLVIDDNSDIRNYIKDHLSKDYNVLEADDGKQGYDLVLEFSPDLVISDVMMPVMDGLELTRKLKSDLRTCHIPLILLTAKATIENKISGLESGADSYIAKPFDIKHLLVRVNKLIESKKKIREHYKETLGFEGTETDLTLIDRKFLNKTLVVIEKNLSDTDFGVEELSNAVAMSRVHLYRKIKQLTGMSVSEYIRSIRIKKAASMLEKSGLNINEIAIETGFSTNSYFTKCFRQYYKVPPSEYAAGRREKSPENPTGSD